MWSFIAACPMVCERHIDEYALGPVTGIADSERFLAAHPCCWATKSRLSMWLVTDGTRRRKSMLPLPAGTRRRATRAHAAGGSATDQPGNRRHCGPQNGQTRTMRCKPIEPNELQPHGLRTQHLSPGMTNQIRADKPVAILRDYVRQRVRVDAEPSK